MADVRADRKLDRLRIEFPGSGRAAHPARIFPAGVGGDVLPLRDRAARKENAQALCKLGHVLLVELYASCRRPLTDALACIRVGETLALRLRERSFLDQHALALVASSRAAE